MTLCLVAGSHQVFVLVAKAGQVGKRALVLGEEECLVYCILSHAGTCAGLRAPEGICKVERTAILRINVQQQSQQAGRPSHVGAVLVRLGRSSCCYSATVVTALSTVPLCVTIAGLSQGQLSFAFSCQELPLNLQHNHYQWCTT